MGLDQNVSVTCPCGSPNQVTVVRSWVVDEPAELARLNALRFNVMTCAACGRTIPLEVELLVTHRAHGWAIQVIPDDAKVDEACEAMGMFAGVRARVVANRNELVEKARLFEAGIDDVAFAICKFQRAILLSEGGKRTFVLWFERVEGDQLVLAAFEAGKHVGHVKIPLAYHAKIVSMFETAQYARDMVVGENLARRVLDDYAARRAAAAPAPAPAPAASAPPTSFAQAFAVRFWVGGGQGVQVNRAPRRCRERPRTCARGPRDPADPHR